MNQLIRNLTSLANFAKARSAEGQTATLLILLTVILLIFVMVTLNVGQSAVTSTALSNAADSTALYLGSQLSTKSRQIYEALGNNTEKCKNTGWASAVFAVVLAIVAVIIIIVSWGTAAPAAAFIIAGAVGGAVGGYAGASYAGTDRLTGAVTGAAIGAAIGSMGAGLAGASTGTAGAGGTIVQEATVIGPTLIPEGAAIPAGSTLLSGSLGVAGAGSVALGALSLASTAYNTSVQQQITSDVMRQFSSMMNKLSDKDRIRESTFLNALQQLVDDPTVSRDGWSESSDSDLDGDTSEYVPNFQIWEFERLRKLGSLSAYISSTFESFITNEMTTFMNFSLTTAQDYLARLDYAWDITWDSNGNITGGTGLAVPGTYDSSLVKLARGLETGGPGGTFPVNFWAVGPAAGDTATPGTINYWMDQDCTSDTDPNCLAPAGFDEVDGLADELLEMAVFMAALKQQNISDISASWENWLIYFYDPGEVDSAGNCTTTNPSSYYCILGQFTKYANSWSIDWADSNPDLLMSWFKEIDAAGDLPPQCLYDTDGLATNYPCLFDASRCNINDNSGCDSGTIDPNPDDEFAPIISVFTDLYNTIGWFRTSLKSLYDSMTGGVDDLVSDTQMCGNTPCGGTNPVRYEWADTRGDRSVIVEIGYCGNASSKGVTPANTRAEKRGNWLKGKSCSVLQNYDDGGNCYVKITRNDGTKNMGALGAWNPFGGSTKKAAWTSYSYNRVGLK